MAIRKINSWRYEVEGKAVSMDNQDWDHAMQRIDEAVTKAKASKNREPKQKFIELMVTRLKKMTKEEKIYCAAACLKEMSERDSQKKDWYIGALEVYDSKFLMDSLTQEWGELNLD